MFPSKQLSRRTVLRGVGLAVSLPWLEAMGPLSAWAEEQEAAGRHEAEELDCLNHATHFCSPAPSTGSRSKMHVNQSPPSR